ncbi:MAG: alpha-glucosidase/alpha-galactosidase [Anaerolineaceae bacterium]|nr:alpha-glucosidase/alpha-galactosidase [Anaerolineaceae bacterium]
MIKVAIIGAGSLTFCQQLVSDILCVPELRDTEFRFMDINPEGLEMAASIARKFIADNGQAASVVDTLSQREAISGADYVISLVRVGGLEAFEKDIEIPLKYGVDQCVGDTLAPGGIFYALRTIPVLLDIAKDMREVAKPNAILINYSNPMAMNTWALRRAGGVPVIGLCHGVQGGHYQIAMALGLPQDEVDFNCVGINHQTWYTQVSYKGMDLLPFLSEAFKKHPDLSRDEKVRIDILDRFGYYSTESNGHLSEYVPWYRKRPEEIDSWISYTSWINGQTGGYLKVCREGADEYRKNYPKMMSGELPLREFGKRTSEHASYIIEALETGRTYRGHFNVANTGLISNLLDGCTVELPCYVDRTGVHPAWMGDLPQACAATCSNTIRVQEMVVEAALTGNKELVKLAVLHDPLTGAVCNPPEVWAMCDEMFEALAQWMPQFNGEGRAWSDQPLPDGGRIHRVTGAEDWLPPALREA